MAASAFSRLYRKVMGRSLEPIGFQREQTEFWRERDGILHVISLHRGDENFTVAIAVQALVDPFETFSLALGDRLQYLGPGIPPRWDVPKEKSEMEQVLGECAQKVAEFAIPWLDRFQSTKDIVEIDARNAWGARVERSNRMQIVALCALDAGMFDKGRELLTQVYKEFYSNLEAFYSKTGVGVPEWAQKRRQMYQELLRLLKDNDREGIRRRLEENKAYTRAALGIG